MHTPLLPAEPGPSFVARHRIRIWRVVFAGLALLLVAGSPAWADSALSVALRLAGVALVSVAALGRLWCALYISGRKSQELVTSGPYSLCRHPLYLFNLMGFMGVAALTESLVALGLTLLAFGVLYPSVIASEDRLLRHRFQAYAAYRRQTPALLPRLRAYHSPARWTVEVNAYLRNIRDSTGFPLLALTVEAVDAAHTAGWIGGWFVLY